MMHMMIPDAGMLFDRIRSVLGSDPHCVVSLYPHQTGGLLNAPPDM